ncbi:hypothetical protein CAI16_20450, partial [Virgibacillus dokdonensis]
MSNTTCAPQCLGSAASLVANTELIKTNLCQPLRQICDGTTVGTIFFGGALPEVNGIFTVTNSSSACTIDIAVTDANGAAVAYTIPPQSSVAVAVDTLTNVTYTCTGP